TADTHLSARIAHGDLPAVGADADILRVRTLELLQTERKVLVQDLLPLGIQRQRVQSRRPSLGPAEREDDHGDGDELFQEILLPLSTAIGADRGGPGVGSVRRCRCFRATGSLLILLVVGAARLVSGSHRSVACTGIPELLEPSHYASRVSRA